MSPHNLDIASKVRSSQYNSITRLIMKGKTNFIAFYSQSRLENLSNREKAYLHTRNTIYWS